MRRLIIILFILYAFSTSYYGHIGAAFYNFENYTLMDFSSYEDINDYHALFITTNKVDDLLYNFGIPISWTVNNSISVIKYANDKNYYSISPATTWSNSEIGNNITYKLNEVTFAIPRSLKNIGPYNEQPQLIFVFNCSSNLSMTSYLNYSFPYNYFLTIIGGYKTCPKVFSVISHIFSFMNFQTFVWGMIVGLSLSILGMRFIRFSMFLFVFLAISIMMLLVLPWTIDILHPDFEEEQIFIIVLVISFFIALTSIKLELLGIVCLGLDFGGVIAFILYNALFHSIFSQTGLYWMCGIFGFISVILAWMINPIVIFFSSPLVGSFIIVHSIGSLIGGFPNEIAIYTKIKAGLSFQYTFYAYLVAIGILVFFSHKIQIILIKAKFKEPEPLIIKQEVIPTTQSVQYLFIRYTVKTK